MLRSTLIAVALGAMSSVWAGGVAGAGATGPGPWSEHLWAYGNDTGGIIPYLPDIKDIRIYRQLAADYCARWRRLSHVTSVHRQYGDYVGFECIDRPGMIH